jgi:hypothetical protein
MKTAIDRSALVLLMLPLLGAGCGPVPDEGEVGKSQQAFLWGGIVVPPGGVIYLPPPPPPPPCLSSAACERTMVLAGKKVRFFSSFLLDSANSNVKRAIIDVHGLNRFATTAFDTMVASAQFAETHNFELTATQDTIIIAPHFPNQTDGQPEDFHHWTDSGWVKGDAAVGSSLSSYAVVDEIVARLAAPGRFPNLKRIIVAGHSAGGQFTHRYAAANGQDGINVSIPMRYVAANPSSYLYVDGARPHYDGSAGFGAPYGFACTGNLLDPRCPGFGGAPLCPTSFNDWHYGLADLDGYAGSMGATALRTRLLGRQVFILVGLLDNDPNHPELDTSCQARLQGPHRLARGMNQMAYLNARFGDQHHTVLFQIDNAGHDSHAMFVAPPGGVGTGSALLYGVP